MRYKQQLYEYPSGLRLIFVKSPEFYTAKINVLFLVGSEDEEKANGVAHLLEHSVFKGTTKLNQEQNSEAFSSLSAEIDASTSSESTLFSASFPRPNLEDVAKLYSHILTDCDFKEEEIDKEKQVIIEEILMHDDMPDQACFDQLVRMMYADVGIGNDIAGEIEFLKNVSTKDLRAFHDAYYHTENMLVSVIGDYDFEDVKRVVEQYFVSPFVNHNKNKKIKQWSPMSSVQPTISHTKKDILQSNVMIGYKSPAYIDMERFDFGIIGFILGGSMNSRLFTKIRNELALCYAISSFEVSYKNNGFMAINFSTTTKNTKKCVDAVNKVVENLIKNGVSDLEFDRAKKLIIDRYLMDLDFPKGNLKYLASTGEVLNGDKITQYLRGCTKEKSMEIFRKYISTERAFISIVSGDKNCLK